MPVQTTYNTEQRKAVAGMIADMTAKTLVSRTVEDAAGIGFGKAVSQGAADFGCLAFDGSPASILGITVRERSVDADKFEQYDSARVMLKGAIWVVATVAVDAGDPVYVRPSNNTFQKDNSNSGVQISNAKWETSAEAGELAIVRLG